jgi:hypothetical protein
MLSFSLAMRAVAAESCCSSARFRSLALAVSAESVETACSRFSSVRSSFSRVD